MKTILEELKANHIKANYHINKNQIDCKTDMDFQKACILFAERGITITYGFYK